MTRSMIMANDVPLKISPDATHISADSGIRSRCSPASGFNQDGVYANLIRPTGNSINQQEESIYHSGRFINSNGQHGSQSSLATNNADDVYKYEIRKLQGEVEKYRDKVNNLTAQQHTYTSMVQAFEKALQGMVKRVETLQSNSEQKECEVYDLKNKINALREFTRASGINVDAVLLNADDSKSSSNGSGSRRLNRQPSLESMNSNISNSSKGSRFERSSTTSSKDSKGQKKNGSGWSSHVDTKQIRSSFSRAFKGSKNGVKNGGKLGPVPNEAAEDNTTQAKLAEKDSVLTDMRLEALTSAHHVDQLRETLNKLRSENAVLRQDNERLANARSSAIGSQHSLPTVLSDGEESVQDDRHCGAVSDRGYRMHATMSDMHRINVYVSINRSINQIVIGQISLNSQCTWTVCDQEITRLFNEYLHRIDPVSSLNMNSTESIQAYQCGSEYHHLNGQNSTSPMTSLGSTSKISLSLNSTDTLSFSTLVPKTNVDKLVRQLIDHRRLVLCGSSGTGKTHLATRLGQHLAGMKNENGVVKIVVLEEGEEADAKVAEELEKALTTRPSVIIIDNLHFVKDYSTAFDIIKQVPTNAFPFIIGTHNQCAPITTLQVDFSCRFVLWAIHIDPVKSFLGRYLRRRVIQHECTNGVRVQQDIVRLVEFLPKVCTHLNKFLELSNTTDVSIGPSLFVECPMNVDESRMWFIRLWNEHIVPYITKAVREGVQLYGKRGSIEDPTELVCDEWPWTEGELPDNILKRITSKDIFANVPVEQQSKQVCYIVIFQILQDPLDLLIKLQAQARNSQQTETTCAL